MRREKYIAPTLAALSLAAAIGVTACGGAKLTCVSPRSESEPYPGDPKAYGSEPTNWPHAILIKTRVPTGAEGVVFGFEVPGSNHWKDSQPMDPAKAGAVALRIGPGPVEFSTQVVASDGSELCEKTLETTYSKPEPVADARNSSSGYVPTGWSYGK